MAKKNENYLAQLNARRMASQGGGQNKAIKPGTPEFEEAMKIIREAQSELGDVSVDDLNEINEFLDKMDGLTTLMDKYAGVQEKMQRFQENTAIIEQSLGDINDLVSEVDLVPYKGYTQDQSLAIDAQIIREFETGSRLSRDLLMLSASQEFADEDIMEDLPVYDGLTAKQTMQVYVQVMVEFENESEIAKLLAYNAGV